MTRLPSDPSGFLVGRPLGDDEATRILSGIKRDTAAILRAMGHLRKAQREAQALRRSRTAAVGRSGLAPAVTPGGRAARMQLDRDPTTGRFVPRASRATGQQTAAAEHRQARDMGEVAKAATDVARTAEASRREAKADRAGQARGKDGRFGAGDRADGQGRLGGAAGAIASSGGALLAGSEQVDPLLGAAGEMRGLASGVRAVVEPLGRAGSGLFGNRESESEGWLRKLWREFRFMRKESAKASRDTLRGLKGVGGGGGEGGGLLSSIAGLLPALIGGKGLLIAGAGALIGGLATWIASAISDTVKKSIADGWELLKKTPIIGSIAQGAESFANWMSGGKAAPLKSARPGMEGALISAANAAGVDPNLVLAIARKESGLDPTAKPPPTASNPKPTAYGLGQFTDDTWLDAIRQFGQKAGAGRGAATTMAEAMALRDDVGLQARMLAEWTGKNAGQARRLAGRNNPADTYAMHVLGEGDGPKFLRALRADPRTPISSVLSAKVIASNPSLFSGATVGDAHSAFGGAVAGASRDIGAPRLPTASAVRPPTASTTPTLPTSPRVAPPQPVKEPRPVPPMESIGPSRVSSAAPAPAARVVVQQPIGQDVRDRGIAHVTTGDVGSRARR